MKKKKPARGKPIGMSNALSPDVYRKRQEYRKRRKLRSLLLVLVSVLALSAAAICIFSLMGADVIDSLTVEAGDEMVTASDFFSDDVRAFFVSDEEIDTAKPGKYPLTIRKGILFYHVTLNVTDTVPPEAKAKHIRIKQGEKTVPALSFVKNLSDKTEVTAKLEAPIDYTVPGDSEVTVILTDLGNNETHVKSKITILPDEIIPSISIEAGYADFSVRDFLESTAPEYEGDCILTELGEDFVHKVGTSKIEIMYGSVVYTVKVTVEDTVPPSARITNKSTYKGKPLSAEEFVEKIFDETEVSVRYSEEPDFNETGSRIIEIALDDSAGNTSTYKVTLTVNGDTEKPVIEAHDRTVYIGDNIRFTEGVTATDNCDGEVKVEVDTGDFDKNTAGEYPIKFIATDKSGNRAEKTVWFTLRTKFAYQYTKEVTDALFNRVYFSLNINPYMNEKDKMRVIYDYVRANIAYTGTSEKSDWEQEAYRGLRSKSGDAFTFYAISRKLLTMAGIENKEVRRINSDSDHYWNMVRYNGEWYHFDTCPHYKDYPIDSFMLTDKEAAEYSKKTGGYYTYK